MFIEKHKILKEKYNQENELGCLFMEEPEVTMMSLNKAKTP